jgi:hypothetical protein
MINSALKLIVKILIRNSNYIKKDFFVISNKVVTLRLL